MTRPLRRSPVRERLLAVAALVALAACGSSEDAPGDGGSAGDTGTSLTIVVTPDEGVTAKTYTLTCDPAGGDHPQPPQACDALDEAGAEIFDPVPSDAACTTLYGGPQTATVTGTYRGRVVDTTFDRINGCEIDRWETLGTTFFAVPML